MPTATVTSKGQITLPRQVREHLHLTEGDRIDFLIEPGGEVRLRPVGRSVQELFGFLRRPDLPASSVEEMTEHMAATIAQDHERIRRGEG
jgi:AbrB family looped-hinge helix DNA binding protein